MDDRNENLKVEIACYYFGLVRLAGYHSVRRANPLRSERISRSRRAFPVRANLRSLNLSPKVKQFRTKVRNVIKLDGEARFQAMSELVSDYLYSENLARSTTKKEKVMALKNYVRRANDALKIFSSIVGNSDNELIASFVYALLEFNWYKVLPYLDGESHAEQSRFLYENTGVMLNATYCDFAYNTLYGDAGNLMSYRLQHNFNSEKFFVPIKVKRLREDVSKALMKVFATLPEQVDLAGQLYYEVNLPRYNGFAFYDTSFSKKVVTNFDSFRYSRGSDYSTVKFGDEKRSTLAHEFSHYLYDKYLANLAHGKSFYENFDMKLETKSQKCIEDNVDEFIAHAVGFVASPDADTLKILNNLFYPERIAARYHNYQYFNGFMNEKIRSYFSLHGLDLDTEVAAAKFDMVRPSAFLINIEDKTKGFSELGLKSFLENELLKETGALMDFILLDSGDWLMAKSLQLK